MNKETLVTLNEWSEILNITKEGNSSPSTLAQLQKISFQVFYTPPTNYFYKKKLKINITKKREPI